MGFTKWLYRHREQGKCDEWWFIGGGGSPPPGQRADVLEVRDVTVRFGGLTALDAVSLTAAPRQVTGIIGPNGAGKTTLLNVLCGFVRPSSGG